QNEIRHRRNVLDSPCGQFLRQKFSLDTIQTNALLHVSCILESSQPTRYTMSAYTVGHTYLVKCFDYVSLGDAISEANARQAVHLRECPQRQDRLSRAQILHRVWI